MDFRASGVIEKTALTLAAALLITSAVTPNAAAQSSAANASTRTVSTSGSDRWLHVRVTNPGSKEETVRVNVPLELAEKVLPTINKDRLHSGKVRFDDIDCHGVDLRALAEAVRTSKDGEFVTVQNKDSDVRVAKQNGTLFVHVIDKNRAKKSQVEVKVPMRVVDALFSAGKDELDLVAALHALSSQGDTELVSVKDEENTVRVWLDSKNVTD
jgi:ABC-type oligopeptide transport system substrate-binding subunit